jgi:hypothetical protein
MTYYLVFTREGCETINTEEELRRFDLVEDPVWVRFVGGEPSNEFWQASGGPAPAYLVLENGALQVYAGEQVYLTFGPAAWHSVQGPMKAAGTGRHR